MATVRSIKVPPGNMGCFMDGSGQYGLEGQEDLEMVRFGYVMEGSVFRFFFVVIFPGGLFVGITEV